MRKLCGDLRGKRRKMRWCENMQKNAGRNPPALPCLRIYSKTFTKSDIHLLTHTCTQHINPHHWASFVSGQHDDPSSVIWLLTDNASVFLIEFKKKSLSFHNFLNNISKKGHEEMKTGMSLFCRGFWQWKKRVVRGKQSFLWAWVMLANSSKGRGI